ncbi:hypothetical protein ACFOJ6_15160 [Gordonia humi]|uniref:hypothetical protein n=1 Tax=Gordonia humi TaxID=686429 RepID=UPI0036165A30
MLHPGDKKPLTILAAAVAVVVVAIAALTTVLVLTDDDGDAMPTVSVQAGDSLERVAPRLLVFGGSDRLRSGRSALGPAVAAEHRPHRGADR